MKAFPYGLHSISDRMCYALTATPLTGLLTMLNRIRKYFVGLKASLWFLPSLMVFGAMVLAISMVELDHRLEVEIEEEGPRFFGASSEGARKVLATIAGSVITVTGVIFSVTILTLSQAAAQYTPRILRNFTRDRGNRVVLGFFVSLFTYCLIVLRTIRGGDEAFIPAVSVLMAILGAIAGIYFLIYFIHHSATQIQASEVLAAISKETLAAVEKLFPEEVGEEEPPREERLRIELAGREWHPVFSPQTGYIGRVEPRELVEVAARFHTVLRMERRIGEFVIGGTVLASALCKQPPGEDLLQAVAQCYTVNDYRSIDQDPGFGVRQIVDMALKALSPSLNDSTTAVHCADHLGAILHRVIGREIPSPLRYKEGDLRVIAKGETFASMMNLAFHEIRHQLRGNIPLIVRLLERLSDLADTRSNSIRRNYLWEHLLLLRDTADHEVQWGYDRQVLNQAFALVARKLEQGNAFVPLSLPSDP
jgi:uncharacterized membrane protein